MIEKVEGIIVSEKDYSETSKILNIITKEYGIIGVIAKGCKSLKSQLRSVTGKLTYGYFNLYYKSGKLSPLISVDVIDGFDNIKRDIKKISYASFLLDLSNQVIKQGYKQGMYDLLIHSLVKINNDFDPMVISNIVELKYLNYLGVMPIIDSCSNCGSSNSIVTLSSNRGGYVCGKCYNGEKMVSSKTIKMLRMFYYVDISKISKLDISDQVKNEINSFLDEYYDQYTGLYLKSKTFLNNINKIS